MRTELAGLLLLLACAPDAAPPAGEQAPDDAADAQADAPPGPSPAPDPADTGAPPPACAADLTPGDGLIVTDAGPFQATTTDGVHRWLGVPFAAPPTGDRRWRLPEPPACDETVRTADAFGPLCPQWQDGRVVGDEDCLQLNVWAPADADGAPVVVWIHGGGHEIGGAPQLGGQGAFTFPVYDGQALARDQGVVVVTTNYRLGPFGFLAHPALAAEGTGTSSGNAGTHDQLAALRWVQRFVAQVGGDPARVLVAGQSAGGVSVCRLVASPLSDGLFSAAAILSGGCSALDRTDAEATGTDLAGKLGCTGPDALACLRATPVAAWMDTFPPLTDATNSLSSGTFSGVVDGVVLTDRPHRVIARGEHRAVPVILGSTAEEAKANAPPITTEAQYEQLVGAYLAAAGLGLLEAQVLAAYPVDAYPSPRDAYVAVASDLKFTCTARRDADAFVAGQDAPVRVYLFDQVPERAPALLAAQGSAHGSDVIYWFGLAVDTVFAGPTDRAVSAAMRGAWQRLASGADPSPPDLAWPRWSGLEDGQVLALGPGSVSVVDDPRAAACAFWDRFTP